MLTEIDMQSTLKSKIDADIERYVILGACNPQLAKAAIDTDRAGGVAAAGATWWCEPTAAAPSSKR